MTSAMATLIVTLLTNLLPLVGQIATGAMANIITLLEKILPVAVQEAEDLVPSIQNIISEIRGSGNITPDQVDALQALSDKYYLDFEAAAADVGEI